jgi:hypothetical protein
MTVFSKKISLPTWSVLLFFVLLAVPLYSGDGGLIPPTRSLEGPEKPPGTLTVVSEPPGLEVFLDGSRIGQTPVWLNIVEPGIHKLWIKPAETDIYVEPGQTTRISFFKGSFIAFSEDREAEEPPAVEKQPAPLKAGRETPFTPAEGRTEDLTPWERFLNRSSPNF